MKEDISLTNPLLLPDVDSAVPKAKYPPLNVPPVLSAIEPVSPVTVKLLRLATDAILQDCVK